MKIIKVVALFVVTVTSAAFVRGSVPIVVATPQRLKAAMKLVTDAQDLLQKGDVAGAKRNVDAALTCRSHDVAGALRARANFRKSG